MVVRRWSKMQTEGNKPALVLAQRGPHAPRLEFTALYTSTLSPVTVENTVKLMPGETWTDRRCVTLYKITGVHENATPVLKTSP